MTNLPRLPKELYRDIVSDPNLERKDILNLCLVSQNISAEAYRILYRRIRLTGRKTINGILETLSSSPRLLKLVQILIMRIDESNTDSWEVQSILITSCINGMTNLREIRFPWDFQSTPHITWTMRLRLPKLDVLCVHSWTSSPIHSSFGAMPSPLPLLIYAGNLDVQQVDCITQLRCRSLQGSPCSPLLYLKHLEVENLKLIPESNMNWAPNLETIIYTGHPRQTSGYSLQKWSNLLKPPMSVRTVGPIYCNNANDLYFIANSLRFSSIDKVIVMITFKRNVELDREAMRIVSGTARLLQEVSVVCVGGKQSCHFEYSAERLGESDRREVQALHSWAAEWYTR